eukprot:1906636-Pleurochrysis_carterae.AAC.1
MVSPLGTLLWKGGGAVCALGACSTRASESGLKACGKAACARVAGEGSCTGRIWRRASIEAVMALAEGNVAVAGEHRRCVAGALTWGGRAGGGKCENGRGPSGEWGGAGGGERVICCGEARSAAVGEGDLRTGVVRWS